MSVKNALIECTAIVALLSLARPHKLHLPLRWW